MPRRIPTSSASTPERRLFLPLPGNETLAARLAEQSGGSMGVLEVRRFPDGESYVRIHSDVADAEVVAVCTLARPDEKILPLLFTAAAARTAGAARVRLVAPYLAYMRQDAVFHAGEALSAATFAGLVSDSFDDLVTVDPHLHRIHDLGDIYRCRTRVLQAAPLLAEWVTTHVEKPLLVGPDEESEQWVAEIAARAGAPHVVFAKVRHGDHDVRMTLPALERWRGLQPVLADDIISSGGTICEAAAALAERGFAKPWAIAVHALYDDAAAMKLTHATAGVATTDTVPHPSNAMSTAPLLAATLDGPINVSCGRTAGV